MLTVTQVPLTPTLQAESLQLVSIDHLFTDDKNISKVEMTVKMKDKHSWTNERPYNEVRLWIATNAYEILWYHIENYVLQLAAQSKKKKNELHLFQTKCNAFSEWISFNRYDIESLTQYTIDMRMYLEGILPADNNVSYMLYKNMFESIFNTAVYLKNWFNEHKEITE